MAYDFDDAPRQMPKVRFETISEAWRLLQAQMGVWIGATALGLVAISILATIGATVVVLPIVAASSRNDSASVGAAIAGSFLGIVLLTAGLIALGGLLGAGYFRLAVRQVRGEPVSFSDLFQVGDILLPMLGSSLLVGLATGAASQFFYIPGLILGGLWMLVGPLIVDRRLGVIEAMTASWKALQGDLVMATCYYFVLSLVASLGALVMGIGFLFTMPLFYLGIALVYRDFFPQEGSHR